MALVSIITPAWNAERFLGETVRSVQAQTATDWEMLIVDDCSTDGTADLVSRLAGDDARIKLVRQPRNGGPALARQAGIDHAGGRYVAFLDSDDLWLPQKLERQLAFSEQRQAAVSYTAFRRITTTGEILGALKIVPASLTYHQLLKNTAIAMSTGLIDRERSGPIAMTDVGYDDYCLWLSILRRGHLAHGLNEDLMRYRVVGGSVSSRPLRSAQWVWHIYREVEGLSFPRAVWCLGHYGARAALKRLT